MGLEKEEAVVAMSAIFKRGNSTNGSNATTGIGIASLTHNPIIKVPTANTLLAFASTCKGFTKKIKRATIRLTHMPM